MPDWSSVEWVFARWREDLPRLGGDPTSRTFELTLSNLVRETIQNAVDAGQVGGLKGVATDVHFSLWSLEGDEKASYLEALKWPRLRAHIEMLSREDSPGLRSRAQAIDDPKQPLWLLNIEDRNSAGLSGDEEWGEGTNFTELVRNLLKSHKSSEQAGGSIGVGKTVLWKFSGISTVLFNSTVYEAPHMSPRFIGVSSLPYHEVDGRQYYGPGHFGEEQRLPHNADGTAAASVRGEHHGEFETLHVRRCGDAPGLTIQIVDFRPPAADDGIVNLDDVAGELMDQVARNWWPALSTAGPPLGAVHVTVRDRDGTSIASESVGSHHFARAGVFGFVECKQALERGELVDELETVGQVARRDVALEFGAPKLDGVEGKLRSHAELGVRLADETEDGCNRMAYFRSPGIVVNYESNLNLSLSARPFHAVLLCGMAVTEPDGNSEHFETFLRTAEPPKHDDWCQFDQLRDKYRQPYRKPLEVDLFKGAEEQIDRLVRTQTSGGRGPQLLARRFPIGQVGGGRSKAGFTYRDRRVWLDDTSGNWRFSARVGLDVAALDNVPDYRWRVMVELHIVGDEGKSAESYVGKLKCVTGGARTRVEGGRGVVEVLSTVSEIELSGQADGNLPVAAGETRVQLDLVGSVYLV